MEKWRGTKCEPGYIQKQKRFQGMMLLAFIAVGIGLFLIGYVATRTRANVFTVLAILMVLPGAKRVIALVVMMPRQSVERERYDRMREALPPDAVLLTDYVFTSPEKIMNLDFVIIKDYDVIGIQSENGIGRAKAGGMKQYMKEYLQKGVAEVAEGYRVKIFDSDEAFYKKYGNVGSRKGDDQTAEDEIDERMAEVVKYLMILAV